MMLTWTANGKKIPQIFFFLEFSTKLQKYKKMSPTIHQK